MRHDLKVGAAVKVTKDCTYSAHVRKGMEGVVISKQKDGLIEVQFATGTKWFFADASDGKLAPVVAAPKKPKAPRGAQMYLGNGSHAWEGVNGATMRLRVPSGWVYGEYNSGTGLMQAQVFVPMPEVVGYKV